jgi:integrase
LNALRQIRKAYKDRRLVDVTEASLLETFGDKGPGTYNKLVAVVRSAMNMAQRAGWIEAAPHIGKRKEPATTMRYLTAEQWASLRAELPEHLRAMAAFAVATGLRWSNVAGLTWDRVSIPNGIAWVEARDAKGRRAIQIPLSQAAISALRAIPGVRQGYVFTYRGKRVGSPKTAWNKARDRAGLPGFRFHDLRHTWASWHAMRGTPQEVLQRLGAWRSPTMVQRYAHLAPSYVAGFADNAKPPVVANPATKTVHRQKRKAA